MAIFGEYETVHELHRHGLGSVSRAKSTRNGDAEPRYIVKTFNPPHRIASHDALQESIREFLDRVRVQQDLASSGASHWVPVYGAGAVGRSAYYVTNYYGRSVQKLACSRVKISAGALHTIVTGVLRGLLELKLGCSRSHGNLKSSNVLLDGEGELETAGVVLADPAPANQLPPDGGETADLICLGEMICELVTHQPPRGAQSYPIAQSPDWARLGRIGKSWRELCNRLLKPDGESGLTLEDVAAAVEAMQPRKRWISLGRVVVVAAILLVAAGAIVGYEYYKFRSDWKQLCGAYGDWVYRFQADIKSSPDRLQRFKRDAHVQRATARLLNDGAQFDPKRVSGNDTLALGALADRPPLSWSALRQTREANDAVNQLQAELSPERWPLLRDLAASRSSFQQRGWEPAAKYLDRLIAETQPSRDHSAAVGIDRLLSLQPKLRQDLATIEERWQATESTAQAIAKKAGDDKILRQFDAHRRRELARSLSTASAKLTPVEQLRDAVDPLAGLAGQLAEVLRADWAEKVDRERFAKEAEIYARTKIADADTFVEWLSEVQDYYRYRPEAQAEVFARLNEKTDSVAAKIEARRKSPGADLDQVSAFSERLASTRAAIAKIGERSWVRKDRRTGAVEKLAAQYQASLDEIVADLSRPVVAKVNPVLAMMEARQVSPAFKLNLVSEPYISDRGLGECLSLTVTPDRECFLVVLCKDSEGNVSMLVPNAKWHDSPKVKKGEAFKVQSLGFELPAMAPYGKTSIKVIGTARPLEFIGAKANPETLFLEGIRALAVGDVRKQASRISDLLKPEEWSTDEAEWVTKDPAKPAAGGAGANTIPRTGDGAADARPQ